MDQNDRASAGSSHRANARSEKRAWTGGAVALLTGAILGIWLIFSRQIKAKSIAGIGSQPAHRFAANMSEDLSREPAVRQASLRPSEVTLPNGSSSTGNLRDRIAYWAKRWHPVFAIFNVSATLLILPLVFGIYDRLAPRKPLILKQLSGVRFFYQPRNQDTILTLDFAFTATNTGDGDGSLQDPYARLEDSSAPAERFIPFGPSDITCKHESTPLELGYIPVPKTSTIQVACSASNVLGPISKSALSKPGLRRLRITWAGDKRDYQLDFCIPLSQDITDQLSSGKLVNACFLKTAC